MLTLFFSTVVWISGTTIEPADDGFQVYETPFGRIGIVVCFDRHYPESIRTTALMDANPRGASLYELTPSGNVHVTV